MDIISRACKIFDKVIVAVPVNPDKRASFTVEERMEMLRTVTADMENVEVDCGARSFWRITQAKSMRLPL